MYDLPSEEVGEPGLQDQFHPLQAQLLEEVFQPSTYPSERVFSAMDLNIYYDENNTRGYKRPDWFGVVGVPTGNTNGIASVTRSPASNGTRPR